MKPLVSVIVPIYNVEKYLMRCLHSLERQVYTNLEIVLVNDGSTDNSGIMCDEFAFEHTNVFVVHQKNLGRSSARNNGIKISSGDFITFVDPDDYVSEDYVEYLMKLILSYQAEVSIAGKLIHFSDDKKYDEILTDAYVEEVLSPSQALQEICYAHKFGVSACSKMYKKKLLLKNPYPEGKVYEDLATTYRIIGDANKIIYGSKRIYYYYQRSDSLMHEKLSDYHLYGLQAAEDELIYISKKYPEAEIAAHYRCVWKVIEFIPRILDGTSYDKTLFKIFKKYIIKHAKYVFKDKNVGMGIKVKTSVLMTNYYIMYLVFKLVILRDEIVKK